MVYRYMYPYQLLRRTLQAIRYGSDCIPYHLMAIAIKCSYNLEFCKLQCNRPVYGKYILSNLSLR